MNQHDLTFLLELLASREELSFLHELHKNPSDQATRNAYSDWLEERGREDSARLVRRGFTPNTNWVDPDSYKSLLTSGTVSSGDISLMYYPRIVTPPYITSGLSSSPPPSSLFTNNTRPQEHAAPRNIPK